MIFPQRDSKTWISLLKRASFSGVSPRSPVLGLILLPDRSYQRNRRFYRGGNIHFAAHMLAPLSAILSYKRIPFLWTSPSTIRECSDFPFLSNLEQVPWGNIHKPSFDVHHRMIRLIRGFADIAPVFNHDVKIIITLLGIRSVSKRSKEENSKRLHQ